MTRVGTSSHFFEIPKPASPECGAAKLLFRYYPFDWLTSRTPLRPTDSQLKRPTRPENSQYRLQYLSSLWQRLHVNYLAWGSPCEIQLSPQVRHTLMEYSYPGMLPPPEIVGLAVEQVHEAMRQWVFPQYLVPLIAS
jgi:hypothetical protein